MEGLIFRILRYLHRKSLFEMLIGGDDISNDVITLGTCFSMFVYILAHCFLLFADSQKSESSVDRKPQGNWKLVMQALLPFPAPLPEYLDSLLSGYCITVFSVTPITGVVGNRFKIYENTLQLLLLSLLLLLLLTPYLILTSIGGDKVLLPGGTCCTWTCDECRKLWTSLNVGP